MDVIIAFGLIVLLFAVLGSGLWIGLSLVGVALVAMEFLTNRPVGDSMMLTIWGASSSWTLTALPLFLWMGEILFRSKLSSSMFKGLAPWLDRLPGRLLNVNVVGCTIFAAISGSSAATCATIGKITLPELKRRGYPEDISVGTLAGAGTLGLLIPPSIIMIVYGVAANVSISKLFLAGVIPGLMLAAFFSGYIIVWALLNKDKVPAPDARLSFAQKLYASRHLIPVVSLIVLVLGAIYSGIATATESAALGVAGALLLAKIEGSLDWTRFKEGLIAACRVLEDMQGGSELVVMAAAGRSNWGVARPVLIIGL
ncbi:MAG: TRAP transporter large permease, partial [Acidovorax sp.]